MIDCTCIDDKNRPEGFPLNKWIKEDEEYRITSVNHCIPQNVLGFSLYEKPLGPECFPYEYFISTRFVLSPENAAKVIEMFNDLGNDFTKDELQKIFDNSKLSPNKKLQDA